MSPKVISPPVISVIPFCLHTNMPYERVASFSKLLKRFGNKTREDHMNQQHFRQHFMILGTRICIDWQSISGNNPVYWNPRANDLKSVKSFTVLLTCELVRTILRV